MCFAGSLLWYLWSLITSRTSKGTRPTRILVLLAFFVPDLLFVLSILVLKWTTASEYIRQLSDGLWSAFYGGSCCKSARPVVVGRGLAAPTPTTKPDVRLSPHPAFEYQGLCHRHYWRRLLTAFAC